MDAVATFSDGGVFPLTAIPSRLPQAALRVRDLAVALRFYRDQLGFPLLAGHEPAGTALVQAPGGVHLLLAAAGADLSAWPGVKEPAPGAWVYLHRPGLPALAADLAARGVTGEGPVEPYPGFRRLLVTDPDGYAVVFWEDLPVTDARVLAIYREGPARLQAAVAGLSAAELALPWAPGKWTVREIVHHVVDSDLDTFNVLRFALAEPGRTIQTNLWDSDVWTAGLRWGERPVAPALALLAAARTWVLDVLAHVPDGLDRWVAWPSGYRAEVRRLLRQVGGHLLHHCGQIEETLRRHRRP